MTLMGRFWSVSFNFHIMHIVPNIVCRLSPSARLRQPFDIVLAENHGRIIS